MPHESAAMTFPELFGSFSASTYEVAAMIIVGLIVYLIILRRICMNEHRFKVGDKVVADRGIATIIKADDDETYSYRLKFVNGYCSWYDETELKPVSDNTFKVDKDGTFCVTKEELGLRADEIAEMWQEATEKEKQEHKLPSPDDLLTKEEADKLLSSVPTHSEDRERLEKIRKDEQMEKHKFKVGDNVRIIKDHVIAQITEKDNLLDAYRTNYKNCWWHGNQLEYVSEDELEKLMQNGSTLMDDDTQTFLEKCRENGWKEVDIKQEAYDEGYKDGVDETWEYVRKLFQLNYMTLEKLFGVYYLDRIINKYTASEVIEKLKNKQIDEEVIKNNLADITTFYGIDEIIEVLKQMKGESENE